MFLQKTSRQNPLRRRSVRPQRVARMYPRRYRNLLFMGFFCSGILMEISGWSAQFQGHAIVSTAVIFSVSEALPSVRIEMKFSNEMGATGLVSAGVAALSPGGWSECRHGFRNDASNFIGPGYGAAVLSSLLRTSNHIATPPRKSRTSVFFMFSLFTCRADCDQENCNHSKS